VEYLGTKLNFWWTKGQTLCNSGMTVGIQSLIFGFFQPLRRPGIAQNWPLGGSSLSTTTNYLDLKE
jgi:hypothetical protein